MSGTFYFFVVLGVLAVVLLVEGGWQFWSLHRGPQSRNIARRIEQLTLASQGEGAASNLLKRRVLSESDWLQRVLQGLPQAATLDRWLLQSGLAISVGMLLGWSLAAFLLAWILLSYLGLGLALSLLGALPVAFLPVLVVGNLRLKRLNRIGAQLPDALDLIGRALRAGHAFQGAMQMVTTECPDPIAAEFRATHDEINFGVPLDAALLNLAKRVPSTDLRYFVIAVMIQRETGGNLAELLDNLSHLMRERIKLLGTIQVLSAEGKLSAWILALLPFVMAGLINAVNPALQQVLIREAEGRQLVGTALVLMVIGIFWLWRLTKIRV